MKDSISKRLEKINEFYGLSSVDLANRLGVQKSSISHLLSGRNNPSFSFITKFINSFPNVSLEWFLIGQGDMLKNTITPTEKSTPVESKENINTNISNTIPNKHTETKDFVIKEQLKNDSLETLIMVYKDNTFRELKRRD
jgi:plasmid maintenance system antidote protein VapI